MSVIFKRKLYNRMLAWKNERKGSTALLVVLSYKKLTQYKST